MLINQFHSAVHNGDAIGEQIIAIRNMAREDGYSGEVFCVYPDRTYRVSARHFSQYARYSSPDNVLLLHYGIGYPNEVREWLRSIPDRKVLVYHNITPPHFFAGISPGYYAGTKLGLQQLGLLRQIAAIGWCDSVFNATELRAAGWSDISVLPFIIDYKRYDIEPDRATLRQVNDGNPVLLYMGRIAPNKRIEDLLIIFYYVQRMFLPEAHLWLVGSDVGMQRYRAYLEALIKRLELRNVIFAGQADQAKVAAYFRSANVYLSMSEHEGFCVPLIEGMYYGVPVIAYDAAAVSETMGGCGLLMKDKNHRAIAELIAQLQQDTALRERIVTQQRQRATAFDVEHVRPLWRAALQRVLEAKP
jgi:L-malate glycosyltransferase